MTDISIIIVTHNHKDYIEKCLNSIPSNLEIILVDNISTDGTPELIEAEYPHVKLIKSNENLGYGKGVNLGVKNSKGNYLVILNPDTIIEENSIEELVKPLIPNNEIITVPKVMLYDGSKINTCGNIEHFTGLTFTRGLGKKDSYYDEEEYLGGLSGVCFALKRDLYHKIGGFDENIFLYMEDAEISWKINSLGYKILYVPNSVFYHDYKLEVNAEKIYHLELGRYIILRKYFLWKHFLVFFPSLIITEMFTMGYALISGPGSVKYKFNAMKDSLKLKVDKIDCDNGKLIQSLDCNIPIDQLSYNSLDKYVKTFGNMIYNANYLFYLELEKSRVLKFRYTVTNNSK